MSRRWSKPIPCLIVFGREADRVEQKRVAMESLTIARQRLEHAERGRDLHQQALARLEAEWAHLWAETGIAPRSPKEMQGWLEQRTALVAQLRDLARLDAQASKHRGGSATMAGIAPRLTRRETGM